MDAKVVVNAFWVARFARYFGLRKLGPKSCRLDQLCSRHVIWVSALSTLLVCLPMIKADMLGRVYAANQATLAWD